MKLKLISLFVIFVALATSCNANNEKAQLKTYSDSLSYAIGMNFGKSIAKDSLKVSSELIKKAIDDAIKGDKFLALKEDDLKNIFQKLQEEMQSKQAAKQAQAGSENKAKGEKFLADNKSKPGVITTASGLQYVVIKDATGAKPAATDKVKVHYHGTTIDGKVFDSSVERNEPIDFALNGVIPGWTEGVQLMSVGSKFKFFIPSELAYGAQGAGGAIGPNEVLIFEVELLDIVK